ncbi:MAG: cation:proton antiporter regulatory subunit [Thermoplasmatota archaeon]
MSALAEAELPGIGRKFTLETESGENVVVVEHKGGRRELFLFHAGADAPLGSLSVNEDEARKLGNLLAGAPPEGSPAASRMEIAFQGVIIEWFPLGVGSALAGHSLREAHIRAKTGCTILAVTRADGGNVANPSGDHLLEPGDTLMAVGSRDQLAALKLLV